MAEPQITDISAETSEPHPDWIDWFENGRAGLCRLNKGQVQAIVKRVYLPPSN